MTEIATTVRLSEPNRWRSIALALSLSAVLLAGCSKKAKLSELPPAPASAATGADGSGPGYGNGATGASGAAGAAGTVVPGSQADLVQAAGSDRIFFDTDQSNIDAEDQRTLTAQAQWLQSNPTVRVVIEGHTDERGTRDYNLALGQRRADAARAYLASLGVDPSRMQTVSYGKERPQALGSDEQAWAQNRRAVTVVIQQ